MAMRIGAIHPYGFDPRAIVVAGRNGQYLARLLRGTLPSVGWIEVDAALDGTFDTIGHALAGQRDAWRIMASGPAHLQNNGSGQRTCRKQRLTMKQRAKFAGVAGWIMCGSWHGATVRRRYCGGGGKRH
ncbi:hypothetical protein HNO88_000438 [Novosphingobium chloroacetimidivorans]|uniref:Uncharacterized protein n=1 Tax=Novosphingobium chloroacetimidivorans TaxID=1428314 RepID=A0A7W7K6L7_9SPHN|nr:hypothetical protein [Novosphingobium chloroacetimidivorans]MBB4857141.1 hypothetical protein [Novosphingobium chloroacetimidivorans]